MASIPIAIRRQTRPRIGAKCAQRVASCTQKSDARSENSHAGKFANIEARCDLSVFRLPGISMIVEQSYAEMIIIPGKHPARSQPRARALSQMPAFADSRKNLAAKQFFARPLSVNGQAR
jgi:hypothetical protein